MKKQHMTLGTVIVGVLAVLGVGVQTVYAAAYTSTQVSAHNTASDCWEIIDGKVYNLTAFIPTHSGGQSVIIAQCGKDASAVFHGGPHGASTINALAQYQVGTYQSASTGGTTTPPPSTTPPATTTTPPANTIVSTPTATVSASSHDEEDEDDSDEGMEDEDEDGYRHHESLSFSPEFKVEHAATERHRGDREGDRFRGHGEDD